MGSQLSLTLCDPVDCSLPGSSVNGIFQARIWNGLPFLPPRDFPNTGIETQPLISPEWAWGFFTTTWFSCHYTIRKKKIDLHTGHRYLQKNFTGSSKIISTNLWWDGGKWCLLKWLRTIKYQHFLGKELQTYWDICCLIPNDLPGSIQKLTGTSRKMQISPQSYANLIIRPCQPTTHFPV